MRDDPLAEYRAALAKVDAFAQGAAAAQAPWLACRRGCDGCCQLRRTAWAVEIEAIRAHVGALPASEREALAARRAEPAVASGERCVFLETDGACAIYPARPIICRTHGPAVQRADAGLLWCRLNFTAVPAEAVAETLPPGSVLDLDRLDALLGVVNARYLAHRGEGALPDRAPLDAALEDS